jgi:hypothetical protein
MGAETALPTYRLLPICRRQGWREMPSFFILDWSVVRFMPRRAAAPVGPPIIQWASRSARRICSRSAASKVATPLGAAVACAFNSPRGTRSSGP